MRVADGTVLAGMGLAARFVAAVITALALLAVASPHASAGFVTTQGAEFRLDGQPWKFGGTNNYSLMYAPRAQVDRMLQSAADQRVKVVRLWAFLDVRDPGSQSGWTHGDHKPCALGGPVYFQYWNGSGHPAYNDGPCGLRRLDYVLDRARRLNLKVTLVLTNNYREFGGMDQYIQWRSASSENGAPHREDFYNDPTIRRWFRDWMTHITGRRNSINGRVYRQDDTIFSWDLANEPSCAYAGGSYGVADCRAPMITNWARVMSDHLDRVAPNQLVSVGDEGYYCRSGGDDYFYNCGAQVDHTALTRLPNVDYASFHNYAMDQWGRSQRWGEQWIRTHIRDARSLGKPAVMGEFGRSGDASAPGVYDAWLDVLEDAGGSGWNHWMLCEPAGRGDCDDKFGERCPTPGAGGACAVLRNHARGIAARR